MDGLDLQRRRFMVGGVACLAAAVLPNAAFALPIAQGKPRNLAMTSINTGEHLDVCYFDGKQYLMDGLGELNHLCRDHRRNLSTEMDPKLYDQLVAICGLVKAPNPITMVSGYRSPATNEMLRNGGGGQAKKSYHMTGQAIDFFVEGVPLASLRKAALSLNAGGVGYYPKSGFIHVDTGPVRAW
ncbi:DUF882 domain-containing protein [Enterovibrio nigricans]|uniref:Murein endopeptidase K n=1 Tax=Enterovibrio nigricans DSM 22720 TaxID=1121868 RepID=A0A1T4UQI9_9GAMM|nr:DUF882 domain-containing protein [Enterovibrio nigricans]PKF51035.1 DUF882 domain-containing protein [Enterovibrio nigricans]SKA54701.1 Uncharacterized conserved protein YcbK, DUF882 family [Enterovibrio nigricans DSM 22720]